MKSKLPDIDLPVDFMTGVEIEEEILHNYNFPCRIHAAIFVLLTDGELDATINLQRYNIGSDSIITILPGTNIQFHAMQPQTRLHFLAYSHDFFQSRSTVSHYVDFFSWATQQPVLKVKKGLESVIKDYFVLLHTARIKNQFRERDLISCSLVSSVLSIRNQYMDLHAKAEVVMSRAELLYRQLISLIMKHFETEKRVGFYARQLGITPQHLSTTVRKISGRTVSEVIAEIVVTDAKAKLKSTSMTIQQISDSLNFPNSSFFGKYFKRYAGMSPKDYRHST